MTSESQWARDLYQFLLREFREPDEASGEVVTRDCPPALQRAL